MTVARYQESPKTRLFLFVSALAPVFIIAGLRFFDARRMLAVLLLVVGVVTFLLTPLVLISRRKAGKQEFVVSNVKDESSQIPTYLITFFFPFLFLSEQMSGPLVASYVGFAALMAVLLYRTSLVLINPYLLLVGYRVFSVDIVGQGGAYIISKEPPLPSRSTYTKRIADGLFIAVDERAD
ncbi:hypothetical protein GSS87_03540 [Corynebacterium sp. 4HC-13]|uniref:hypothetical protein n=1 Tax=Corynebacterium anserum TaxID=2684406 RepID=UPI0016396F00|nr:hypothetical protein [Corynebacterium anserum]MBC2681477.1 hypothetical protein [Corynebacterium anserum]